MKKDIPFPPVEGVFIAIAQEDTGIDKWDVYVVNTNDFKIEN